MPGTNDDDEPVDFELSEDDLKAIAEAPSEVVADEPSSAETPYTIRNAPVAKSIMPADAFLEPAELPVVDDGTDSPGDLADDD